VASSSGETDVVAEWADSDGKRLLLLIEDKLTAAFQPQQGARYASRAAELGANAEVRTILAAPASYLAAANPEASHFGHRIALEDVLDWMQDADFGEGSQALARAREGLHRAVSGVALGAKGLFPTAHSLLADHLARQGSSLRITNNATDWVFFDFPSRPVGLEVRYRIRHGIPELAFTPFFRGSIEHVLDACREPFEHSASGGYRFIRNVTPASISDTARAGNPTQQDVHSIVNELEHLIRWWQLTGRPAANLAGNA